MVPLCVPQQYFEGGGQRQEALPLPSRKGFRGYSQVVVGRNNGKNSFSSEGTEETSDVAPWEFGTDLRTKKDKGLFHHIPTKGGSRVGRTVSLRELGSPVLGASPWAAPSTASCFTLCVRSRSSFRELECLVFYT